MNYYKGLKLTNQDYTGLYKTIMMMIQDYTETYSPKKDHELR